MARGLRKEEDGMQALLWGVRPDRWEAPDPSNPLLEGLAAVPMRLIETDRPRPVRHDWAVARTRLTGICGSESKQVFGDFTDAYNDSALATLFSFPMVMGHEVVAEITELGPAADGPEPGQRVVLNPWLSCAPRGVGPPCAACRAGDLSTCWHFTEGPLAAGIHIGTCKDASSGWRFSDRGIARWPFPARPSTAPSISCWQGAMCIVAISAPVSSP